MDYNLAQPKSLSPGELPSDDSTVPVLPGRDHVYHTSLPADHMPGTHWLHPHRHGSTALQVAGGAALALIVDDLPGTLPAQVESAPEVLLVVMQIDQEMTNRIAQRSGDSWFQISGGTLQTLVNGEVNPTILISAGQWTRFRVIYTGWLEQALEFNIVGCEMALLAKDCSSQNCCRVHLLKLGGCLTHLVWRPMA